MPAKRYLSTGPVGATQYLPSSEHCSDNDTRVSLPTSPQLTACFYAINTLYGLSVLSRLVHYLPRYPCHSSPFDCINQLSLFAISFTHNSHEKPALLPLHAPSVFCD